MKFSIAPLALLALLIVAIISGCGGGSGTPQIPAIPVSVPSIDLSNGQLATLRFDIRGRAINGTIRIENGDDADPIRRIPVGTYPFSGTFTPPRGYDVGGTLGAAGPFTARGDLPTNSQEGTYTLNFQGQSISGILPELATPID